MIFKFFEFYRLRQYISQDIKRKKRKKKNGNYPRRNRRDDNEAK